MQKLPYLLLAFGFLLTAVFLTLCFTGPLLTDDDDVPSEDEKLEVDQYLTENYLRVYFFNVSNPEEVVRGSKPDLQEIGPYVYQETISRITDLSEDGEENEVSYKDMETYFFRPDLSTGEEDDVLTIVNVPYAALAEEMSKLQPIHRNWILNVILRFHERLFLTKTVSQLLFGGFRHELLIMYSSITGDRYMPNNTFGLLYGTNNSASGKYTVHAGLNSSSEFFGEILLWNGKSELEWWKERRCNKIEGAYDGTLFPAGFAKDSQFRILLPSLCRTFAYGFTNEVTYDEVIGYRYAWLPSELEDPRERHENLCYCTQPGKDYEDCPSKGSYQLNACFKDAAISLSLPHFLHASDEYLESANGFHPDAALHESCIDIEPKSGLLLKSVTRAQVNVHLKRFGMFPDFKEVRNMLFPAIWTEKTREMSAEKLEQLRSESDRTPEWKLSVGVGLAIGLSCVALGIGILIVRSRRNRSLYNA